MKTYHIRYHINSYPLLSKQIVRVLIGGGAPLDKVDPGRDLGAWVAVPGCFNSQNQQLLPVFGEALCKELTLNFPPFLGHQKQRDPAPVCIAQKPPCCGAAAAALRGEAKAEER